MIDNFLQLLARIREEMYSRLPTRRNASNPQILSMKMSWHVVMNKLREA